MGAWGTGLYSNDTSSDVRDICNEIYPLLGVEEGTKQILKEYAEIVDSDVIDNEYANFWFALADWQWKHGVLTEDIKAKAIALLEAHTGIEEWEDSGTAADVRKRLAVMDKLLEQLRSPQPETKIPKAKIAKPKHKPGDIIVFRTCSKEYPYAEAVWNIEVCGFSDFYVEEVASRLPEKLSPPYEAYETYMAVVCVGEVQETYSQYVPDVMQTHSIYAYYDYISDKKPTLDDLKQCGFLPLNIRYSKDGGNAGKNAWTYTFTLYVQRFTKTTCESEQIIEKIRCPHESERFHALFANKHYDNEYLQYVGLFQAFSEIYDEKVRLKSIGIELDNLLDADHVNPALRTPEEIAQIVANKQREWEEKIWALEHSEAYQNASEEDRLAMLRDLI